MSGTVLRVEVRPGEHVDAGGAPSVVLGSLDTLLVRVDTCVLQVVYSMKPDALNAFSGQQVDVFIEASPRDPTSARSPADTPDAGERSSTAP